MGNALVPHKAAPPQPANYPPMMKLPPSFPFYPRHLYRYEGYGSVNNKAVLLNIAIGLAVSAGAFLTVQYFVEKNSKVKVPESLSDEWRKATEDKRLKDNADPLDRYKVGQKL